MNANPIASPNPTAYQQNSPTTTAPGPKTLGQDDFLKLLAVQMQAQDPLNPMQDTEFISQMANFTSLEQMKNLTKSFNTFTSEQRSVNAQNYLGKTVTVLDSDQGYVTGSISGVTFKDGDPKVIVNGKTYDPALITTYYSSATPGESPTASN